MDYLKTDEEQGEALKRWLVQNGLGLLIAIASASDPCSDTSSGNSTR